MRGFKEGIHEKSTYKLKNSVIMMTLLFHAVATCSNTLRLKPFFLFSFPFKSSSSSVKTGLLLEYGLWGVNRQGDGKQKYTELLAKKALLFLLPVFSVCH